MPQPTAPAAAVTLAGLTGLALLAGRIGAPAGDLLGAVPSLLVLAAPAWAADRWLPVEAPAVRGVVALAVTVVDLVCVGLLLVATPVGATRATWVTGLGLVAYASVTVSLWGRPGGAAQRVTLPERIGLDYRQSLLVVGCVAALTTAGVVSLLAARHRADSFTELALGPAGTVVVTSAEARPEQVQLQVTAGGAVLRSWPPVVLGPGQRVSYPLAEPVATEQVQLLRLPSRDVYRSLTLHPSLPVSPPPTPRPTP